MSNILLAQPILEDGWIDLSVGEPHLIRETLLSMIDVKSCLPNMSSNDFIYPSPQGAKELVEYLENKYKYPVVVTNGAKQGLGATFYAIEKMGIHNVGMRSPHWALIPELADMHQIRLTYREAIGGSRFGDGFTDADLIISPNNPDGHISNLATDQARCIKNNVIMVHDAAYYTGIYMGPDFVPEVYGDVQVFSMSKMLGLSSLRLGFVVCKNQEIYKHILHYMEHMTVGVGKLQQLFALNILNNLNLKEFENKCFSALQNNRKMFDSLKPGILKFNEHCGMFLWAKLLDSGAFKRAKLHIISGESFGDETFVRINLGLEPNIMQEVVHRLNK